MGDDLASIYLDLAQAKIAPVGSHPHSTMLSIAMLRAQENGMFDGSGSRHAQSEETSVSFGALTFSAQFPM